MLKSKKLEEYFLKNQSEKVYVQTSVQRLRKQIKDRAKVIPDQLPDYLTKFYQEKMNISEQ